MSDETKMPIKETLGLLGYGYKLVHSLVPAYLPCTLLRSLLTAAQPLAVLFFSARILNELAGGRDEFGGTGYDINKIILYVSLAVGLTFVFSVIKAILSREVEYCAGWERVFSQMQLMEAEQFTSMDFAHVEDGSLGEKLARMDTHARGNGLGLLNVFYYTIMFSESFFSLIMAIVLLTGLSMGGIVSLPATLALFALFAAGMAISVRYNAKEKAVLENVAAQNAKANTAAPFYYNYVQPDNAAKDIRLYGQSEALMKIMKDSFNAKSWISFYFFAGRHEGFSLAVLAAVGGGFYMLTGYGALSGAVPVGSIVQTVGAVTALATAAGTIINIAGKLWNNAAFLKPMREFMTLPDVLAKGDRAVGKPQGIAGQNVSLRSRARNDGELQARNDGELQARNDGELHLIEFRDVTFCYPGAEVNALENLSLTLTPGERLAVVGLNGSGKTTMVKLLCRLYDPTAGEILLDGINIKEYNYDQYIALFSVVFQDFMLFPFRLGQNVAVSEDFDEKRVNECLDGAGFAERQNKMPCGLDTILYKSFDEDGTEVSGGEAQKIALARALYRDAPIVVLDEPTAALDPIAEYEVYTTFDKTIGGKTAVFISHRLSSCRFCHRVAVFDGGRLTQLGTHESLLEDKEGRYFELWEAQAGHYR